MISTSKNFLFIHVPKTGGNSIQNVLHEYASDKIVCLVPNDDGLNQFEVRNDKYAVTKHSTLQEYADLLEPDVYARLFKFGTIRNPWERLVSLYFTPDKGRVEWSRDSFKRLIRKSPTLQDYLSLKRPKKGFVARLLSGEALKPEALVQDVDFLIRFENLEGDFAKVCDKLGLPRCSLPKRNQSKHRHYSHYYDEQLVEMVAKKYRQEIAWGSYQFEAEAQGLATAG